MIGLGLSVLAEPKPAAALILSVRGEAHIVGGAALDIDGRFVTLRGTVTDDRNRPIGGGGLRIDTLELDTSAPRPSAPAAACGQGRLLASPEGGYRVETDQSGAFCLKVESALVPPRARWRVSLETPDGYDPATVLLAEENIEDVLHLEWSRVPNPVALDGPPVDVVLIPRLAAETGRTHVPKAQVLLELLPLDGSATPVARLGSAEANPDQPFGFRLEPTLLGEPGPAKLSARLATPGHWRGSSGVTLIERTVKARVRLEGFPETAVVGELVRGTVTVVGGVSFLAPGTVEIRNQGTLVSSRPLVEGRAEVALELPSTPGSILDLSFRYLPSLPGWLAPPEPNQLRIAVNPPSPWRHLPWVLGGVLVVAWLGRARIRVTLLRKRPLDASAPANGPPSRLELLKTGNEADGWTGTVVDLHEGTPLAEVTLRVVSRGFSGEETLLQAVSDQDGRFRLPWLPMARTVPLRFTARGRSFAILDAELPVPGLMVLRMVSRRRWLLERLVSWAKRSDRSFVSNGEPTPQAFAIDSQKRGQETVARWAFAVEEAAYGPNPPGEQDEARLRSPSSS